MVIVIKIFYNTNKMIKQLCRKNELMTEGNITQQIFLFAVPLIIGNFLQQFYNTADSIIVGNFIGSNALAAVGSSTPLINLLIAFSQGTSVGAGVVISQYLGAKDRKGTHNAVHTSLALALILGLVLTIGGIFLTKPLLLIMKVPQEVLLESVTYLQIFFGGLVFNVIYNMATGILNASGNSKRSLIYLAYASLINIILDVIFVVGFKFGVEGAAIATVISQFVSAMLTLNYLIKKPAPYRVKLKDINCYKHFTSDINKISFPIGIQNMVVSLSNVFVQTVINSFGAITMAGFGICLKLDGFIILPIISFSMAATTFVGQNYGSGNRDRVKKGMWVTIFMTSIYSIIIGAIIVGFADFFVSLFTNDNAVISSGKLAVLYLCPYYITIGILYSLAGAVRGVGKSIPPMVILLISMCIFRILWVKFIYPIFGTIGSLYILYPTSWTIGMILMIIYTVKVKWLKTKEPLA